MKVIVTMQEAPKPSLWKQVWSVFRSLFSLGLIGGVLLYGYRFDQSHTAADFQQIVIFLLLLIWLEVQSDD